MATVFELFESREGDTRGITGTSASRLFHVEVDTQGDDPIETLNDEDGSTYIGVQHPNANYPLYVTDLAVRRRQTQKVFQVEVRYGIAGVSGGFLDHPAFPGWQVRMASIAEQTQMIESLSFNPAERKIIGVPFYRQAEEGEATNYIVNTEVDGDDAEVRLVRKKGIRKRLPFTVLNPKASLTMNRSFAVFDYSLISPSYLTSLVGKVNHIQFLSFPPGTCKFVFWEIVEQFGNTSESTTGVLFNVSLNFEIDFTRTVDLARREITDVTGHTPYQIAHTWIDPETQEELPIFDTSIPDEPGAGGAPRDRRALENFNVAFYTDFNLTLQTFNSLPGGP